MAEIMVITNTNTIWMLMVVFLELYNI